MKRGWIDAYLWKHRRREALREYFGSNNPFWMALSGEFGRGNNVLFGFYRWVLFRADMPEWFLSHFKLFNFYNT